MAKRDLVLTYGAFRVGPGATPTGSMTRHIDGNHDAAQTPDSYSLTVTILVANAADPDELETELAVIRGELGKPALDLRLFRSDSDATLFEAKHSTAQALKQTVSFGEPAVSVAQTGLSAELEVTFAGERPATYDADRIRSSFRYRVEEIEPSGLRQLTVEGEVTATEGGDKSLANLAAAGFAARVAAIQTALGGSWAAAAKPFSASRLTDQYDHVTEFSQTYIQRLVPVLQSGDDARIRHRDLTITPRSIGLDGTEEAGSPLQELQADVTYFIDVGSLTGTQALRDLWEDVLLDDVIAELEDASGSTSVAIGPVAPTYDPGKNAIRAVVSGFAAGDGLLISRRVTYGDVADLGVVPGPTWPNEEDGARDDPTSADQAHVARRSKRITRRVTTTERLLARERAPELSGAGAGGGGLFGIFNLGEQPTLGGSAFDVFGGGFGIGGNLSIRFGGGGSPGIRSSGARAVGIASGGYRSVVSSTLNSGFLGIAGRQLPITVRETIEEWQVWAAPPPPQGGGRQPPPDAGTRTVARERGV